MTPGKERAMARVASVEASSTTTISNSSPLWATSDSRHAARDPSSLRAGTITDTSGADLISLLSGAVIVMGPNQILYSREAFSLVSAGPAYGSGGLLRRLATYPHRERRARLHH